MKTNKQRRSQLVSFLIGILFCLFGIMMLIYLTKDFIIETIRKPTVIDEPIEQPLPNEIPANTIPDPQSDGIQQDEYTNLDPNRDTGQTMEYSSGKLGEAHGSGGRSHLRKVAANYTNKEEFVHNNVYSPLMKMIAAAEKDGVSLTLVSAYRSYGHQKGIWERKWGNTPNDDKSKASNILRYSSFPGSSRHHWGTDVDFNSVTLDYWKSVKGRQTHEWLVNNGPSYGFCEIYAPGRRSGYSDEPWHWSHTPTANTYYNQMSNPQVLGVALSQNIKGATAVKSMADTMMGYVTGVSNCPSGRPSNNSGRTMAASPNREQSSPRSMPPSQGDSQSNPQPYITPSNNSQLQINANSSDNIEESYTDEDDFAQGAQNKGAQYSITKGSNKNSSSSNNGGERLLIKQ